LWLMNRAKCLPLRNWVKCSISHTDADISNRNGAGCFS
jgi:hypothetical protein